MSEEHGHGPTDQNMESVIPAWIGEARHEDQRKIGELTAQVERETPTSARRGSRSSCDAARNEPPGHKAEKATSLPWRGDEMARVVLQVQSIHLCSGDRYPELVTAIEDPAQGPMETTRWNAQQIQVSRHLYLSLVMLTEDAALRIVQAVHDSNGAEALRLMYRGTIR